MANIRCGLVSLFDRVPYHSIPIINHHSKDEVMGYQSWPHLPLGVVYWPIQTPRKLPSISADFCRHGGGHSEVGGGRYIGVGRGSAGLTHGFCWGWSAKKRNGEQDNKSETRPKVLIPTYMRFFFLLFLCPKTPPLRIVMALLRILFNWWLLVYSK